MKRQTKVNNMRKLVYLAIIALAGTLALSACGKKQEQAAGQQQQAQNQGPKKPASKSDTQAWNAYLSSILSKHLQGMKADSPFAYMIPAGDSDADKAARQRQEQAINQTVQRGVLPGNLLAFAGADSKTTADIVVQAFQGAQKNSMKGVIVLFIGDKADEQRVQQVVAPTGAKFRFVQM